MSDRNRHFKLSLSRRGQGIGRFALLLLAIELLDELVFGVREAAWPLIRADLSLSYVEIGLLLSLPSLVASLVEPLLGVLGDVWQRRRVVLAGGLLFALSVALTAAAADFGPLLFSFLLFYPASGAFVSLSQATLMDLDPSRREQWMARWTLAGSVGVVLGPLSLGALVALGAGWRALFACLAWLTLLFVALVWQQPFPAPSEEAASESMVDGLRVAVAALRRPTVLRWLLLLEFSDFMLDILLGFLALYMVDVVGVSPVLAGGAVTVWVGVGLLGDLLLLPLLERVEGLRYLRVSAALMLCLYPMFLLLPGFTGKVVLLAAMGFLNAGWYAILMGHLYGTMPGRSGTVMAVSSLFGLLSCLLPALFGWLAQRAGLGAMMWLLLLGPFALLLGLPRAARGGDGAGGDAGRDGDG